MTTTDQARPTVLDRAETPFPLDLVPPSIPAIRALTARARRGVWDPRTAVPWAEVNPSQYSAEQIEAGRLYWSRRAWSEYGAISESPALQLRYAIDRHAPDISLYWTIRTQEEARHVEVCARMAHELGGYIDSPPAEDLAVQAASLSTRDLVLDPERPLEATIAGLVCVAETIVYDVFLKLVRATTNPAAKQVFRLILRDEVRHCDFGWEYLAHRMPALSPSEREGCRAAMISMVQDVELAGYRSAWLASEPAPGEVELDATVFAAGLGGSDQEWEAPILVESIRGVRARAERQLGIDLPQFHHDLLGAI